MSTAYVILVVIFACSAAIAAAVWVAERLDPPPRDLVTGGGQHIARTGADEKPHPDLDALTPGPVGTGWLEPVPDDDPADNTGVQPVATCELGAPVEQYLDDLFPPEQYVGELFDGHAGATP